MAIMTITIPSTTCIATSLLFQARSLPRFAVDARITGVGAIG